VSYCLTTVEVSLILHVPTSQKSVVYVPEQCLHGLTNTHDVNAFTCSLLFALLEVECIVVVLC